MRLIKGLITAAIAMALFAMPAAALAKHGDRNHDRIPDKWEKRHHLSTRVNVARKDPDKDGLNNLAEFRDGTDPQDADTDNDGVNDGNEIADQTNPRKDDSDNDGVEDGNEISGTIVSFDNNVLTIQLPGDGAGTVSGTVNDATRIECDDDAPATTTATAASDGGSDSGSSDDNSGSGSTSDNSGSGSTTDNSGTGSTTSGSGDGSDDNQSTTTTTTTTTSGSDDGANHDAGDDPNDDQNENACTSADLKPGARVHEAKTMTASDGSTVFTKIELVPAA